MTGLGLPDVVASEPAAEKVADKVKTKKAAHDVRLDDELCFDLFGELRTSPDLGERTYLDLRSRLDGREATPALPSQAAVTAMTAKQRATVRRLAERCRTWAGKLLDLLDQAKAIEPVGTSEPGDAAVTPLAAGRAP